MLSYLSVACVLLVVFAASVLTERVLGRSRKEMQKPGWFVVFFLLFPPLVYLVYTYMSVDSQFLYAAYGAAGSVAALFAQALFGARLPLSGEDSDV